VVGMWSGPAGAHLLVLERRFGVGVAPLRKVKSGRSQELVALRLEAVRDKSLPMTERLRAAEQLENRGMGKPKETGRDHHGEE
jgi:hypothetical protein